VAPALAAGSVGRALALLLVALDGLLDRGGAVLDLATAGSEVHVTLPTLRATAMAFFIQPGRQPIKISVAFMT
jgi:hypothetical protein